MALSKKQRAFVEEYLICWNATEAALRAGYSERSARSIGSENLSKPDIKALIDVRLAELKMSADEVVRRLADMARADIADFIEVLPSGDWRVDLRHAKEAGLTHLIKKLSRDREGNTVVELHDPQSALDKLGRHYNIYRADNESAITVQLEDDVKDIIKRRLSRIASDGDSGGDNRQPDS